MYLSYTYDETTFSDVHDLIPFTTGKLLLSCHALQFTQKHFQRVMESLLVLSPSERSTMTTHKLSTRHDGSDRHKDLSELWKGLKEKQLDAKKNNIATLTMEVTDANLMLLLLVALRLSLEYDVECNQGFPETQYVVSEFMCKQLKFLAKMMEPSR